MFKAAIFDIDGTLVLTGHAGIRALAFSLAIHDPKLPNDRLPFDYSPHGKTDPLIFREIYQRLYRRDPTDAERTTLRQNYLDRLPAEMDCSRAKYRVLPGVAELLDALDGHGVALGLGTGNFSEGARIKLEPGDLHRRFRFGGFGDDAEDRAEMIRVAIRRGRDRLDALDADECVVIGDTARDIEAAHAAGAAAIGVATGIHDVEELSEAEVAAPTLESDEVYRFLGLAREARGDEATSAPGSCR